MDRERQIREHAYYLWEQEGRPHGRALAHWAVAELALNEANTQPSASKKRAKHSALKPPSAKPSRRSAEAKKTHATLQ